MSMSTPGTANDLAAELAEASAARRSVAVVGGGTRSRRGRPFDPDISLSTAELRGVLAYEPAEMTVTVRAGTLVTELGATLAEEAQLWPHADEQTGSTVGGVLATASSGLARLRYGPVRDSLLEVVVATGDGRVIRAGSRMVKSVAGYDLPRLMVGAQGTLGVILEATLRLWPRPAAHGWFVREGPIEELLEVAAEVVRDHKRPWSVVLQPDRLWVQLGGPAVTTPDQWGVSHADAPGPMRPSGRGLLAVGVPPTAVADAVAALAAGNRPFRAQVGVGTIDVAVDDVADVDRVRALAISLGGHAVVVDGPPELRTNPIGPSPPGIEIMRRLRVSFDPGGVLNRGMVPFEEAA